ncbi:MAG: class I SAM-dependent methyltransferase [Deltaproteobacteria bacterium]|nr:class I SAM-dependent methyltransferase [Deltaproteobacteria bacterium]
MESANRDTALESQSPNDDQTSEVRRYWQKQPCGTRDVPDGERKAFFKELERQRYEWEPSILEFARFERGRGRRVLEIGVGAGTDFINWARHGAELSGIDLTEAGVALANERLALEGLTDDVQVGNAEALPFDDDSFDIVYSYGVLHHSPDTERCLAEVHRVLRPGGTALIMLYNVTAWTAWNLWAFHGLAKGRPWLSPRQAVYDHLESPGTKAYTARETTKLFHLFSRIERMETAFLGGDLLRMSPSEKYPSRVAKLLFALYPRPIIRFIGPRFGFARMIEATK